MADEKTLEELLPVDGTSEFQVEIASLTDGAQDQAQAVVEAAAADGTLDDLDLDEVVSNARDADEARENAENLQVDQAKAAADGDYEKAEELSVKAEYELREVEDKGDDPLAAQNEIRDADYDQMDLENADYHQEIGDAKADAAADAAEDGDFETAESLSDDATDEIEVADDYGGNDDDVEAAENVDADDSATVDA